MVRRGSGCFFFEWVCVRYALELSRGGTRRRALTHPSKNLFVHVCGSLRRPPPSELRRPFPSPLSQQISLLFIPEQGVQRCRDRRDVVRVEEHRRVARRLAEGGKVRACDGRARRLCLEDREPESFREGRLDESASAGDQGGHLRIRYEADGLDALGQRTSRLDAREDERERWIRRAHERPCPEQPIEVLVRLVVAEKEKIREIRTRRRRRFFERRNWRKHLGQTTRGIVVPLFPF